MTEPLTPDATPDQTPDRTPKLPASLTRRRALGGAATLGVAAPVLAACGSSDSTDGAATGDATSSAGGTGASDGVLAAAKDVPEGGGVILSAEQVVLTQPEAGEYKAFSSICTHEGCQVTKVSDGVIVCPCHGSRFSIVDGSVVGGPAPGPLAEVAVTVDGGEITRA